VLYWARGDWTFFPFPPPPPSPTRGEGALVLSPPWWGREPWFSLPPGGGGCLGSPSPLVGEGGGGGEIVPNSTVLSITPPAHLSDTGGVTPPARPSDTGGLTPPARPWGADVTPLAILTSAGVAGANIQQGLNNPLPKRVLDFGRQLPCVLNFHEHIIYSTSYESSTG
jgi:hypothetical protein